MVICETPARSFPATLIACAMYLVWRICRTSFEVCISCSEQMPVAELSVASDVTVRFLVGPVCSSSVGILVQ